MTGVVAANAKLHRRAVKLIHDLTGVPPADAEMTLVAANGSAKAAVLMLRCTLSADEAAARLHEHNGDLAAALGERTRAGRPSSPARCRACPGGVACRRMAPGAPG